MEEEEMVPLGRGTARGRGKGYHPIKLLPTDEVDDQDQVKSTESSETANPRLRSHNSGDDISRKEVPRGQEIVTIGIAENRTRCITNFVRLIRSTEAPVYQYNISLDDPELNHSKVFKKILKQLETVMGPVHNFEGHILYLPHKLESEVTVINCVHPINLKEVRITLKFVKEKEAHELIHFYDILFARVFTYLGFMRFRRGFYEMANLRQLQNHKNIQVWPGICVTVEYKEDGLMIMFDSTQRIIRTDTVYDYWAAMEDADDAGAAKKFAEYMIGKIIMCRHNGKCYKIDDVDWNRNPSSTFEYRGRQVTFLEYYQTVYGVKIKNLMQPMLISIIRPRETSFSGLEYVPSVALVPELCSFTGLTEEQRDNRKIVTDINLLLGLNPNLRVNLIKSLIERIMEDKKARSILSEWGIELERSPILVDGHEIKPPFLKFAKFGGSKLVDPNFSKDACRSCYDPVEVKNYILLCTKHDKERAQRFITYYRKACAVVGINLRCNPTIIIVEGKKPSDFVEHLKILDDRGTRIQFVIIITPNHREDLYRAVKAQCTNVYSIPSQCILSKTLNPGNFSIALHICLQVNCKLGGAPWALNIPVKRLMFIGMDAAHDPKRKNSSVIALIASLNDKCTRYFSRANLQPIHQEVATCLRIMFIDALHAYMKENGILPDRIIFYRDGGNAGTFEILKKYEVYVCLEVLNEEAEKCGDEKKKIDFSYVCVAKRIPQRLLQLSKDGIKNPCPGTVVDSVITQPHLYDFYIVSQRAQHETMTPTHYTVLHETTPTKPDLMQKLAYAMTYMYYNYYGAIKVPAVVQYAHKLGQYCSRTKTIPSRSMENGLFYL